MNDIASKAPAAQPRLLVVDDDADMLRLLSMRLNSAGYRVSTAGSAESALAKLQIERPQLVLSDVRLPGRDGLALFSEIRQRHPSLPVILLTAHGTIPDAVEATARGVFTYLTKPYDAKELLDKIAQALALGAPHSEADHADEGWRRDIISRSGRMADLLAEARMVATSDASVLLRGDSGTGKEMLAQAIHRASPRAQRPFMAVNCGAIPEALLESELFGHMKGAFTDAVANHKGLFQAADGGTLLLDEIGDMPPALQVKLLRVLQERAVRPVGSSQSHPGRRADHLRHAPRPGSRDGAGQFREDLYYRLNVVTLTLPTLARAARRHSAAGQPLPAAAGRQVRPAALGLRAGGAEGADRRALAGQRAPALQRGRAGLRAGDHAAGAAGPGAARAARALRPGLTYAEAKQRFERDYLVGLLKLTDGNVADAARLADRNRTEFYRLLQKHELTPGHFQSDTPPGVSPSGDGAK